MRASLIIALSALMLTPAVVQARPVASPAAVDQTTATQALTLGREVADWQLAHMDGFDYTHFHRYTADPRGWIQGALFVGLAAFAQRTGDPRYAQAVRAHGLAQGWGLGHRPLHADDQVIGQAWLWVYSKDRDPAQIAALRARFDAILANPPIADLAFVDGTEAQPCQARWCWSDALFMAPAAWTGLSQATGDPRYAAYADKEFWATTDYLLDKQEHLYVRDSRYLDRRDDQGRKIFWSRGNGWAYAGIVDVLKTLPADHPSRPRYEALFRQMSDRLLTLQKPDGCWAPSLLAPEHAPPETSGTAFFVYGLAYGVNHGLLKGAKYDAAVARGWSALAAAVQPDGKLGWVQQVGYAPDHVSADDTQLYGVGAFLLAASEVGAR
ncbi:glucuronyl hydrolase [Caulobacter sp. Root655]|uniref:glycoside hydrolase family 88/105 protein n=1 Tax=Caulobacter sp. Root655 TaxID=1736578 RepID=UPI0006F3CE94|nr:glycoside hydrolase family 88 protein [Caulobacter sp. Root655]KRA59551.1 glucuronyl hydrolase [Caulobacter sp. Root655]